jgi:NTP pyrophosphatase (non-canonical NTP hydrolase)
VNQMPDEAQRERLTMLAEEAAEVIQAVTKILRHGWGSNHPENSDPNRNNTTDLTKELADMVAVNALMAAAEDIDHSRMSDDILNKLTSIRRYGHHQPAELLDYVESTIKLGMTKK